MGAGEGQGRESTHPMQEGDRSTGRSILGRDSIRGQPSSQNAAPPIAPCPTPPPFGSQTPTVSTHITHHPTDSTDRFDGLTYTIPYTHTADVREYDMYGQLWKRRGGMLGRYLGACLSVWACCVVGEEEEEEERRGLN